MRFANQQIDKKLISELAECDKNSCDALRAFIADACAGRIQRSGPAYLILYNIATGKTKNLKLIAECLDGSELSSVFDRTSDPETDHELIEDLSTLEIISDVCDVIMNKIREHADNGLLISAVDAVVRLGISPEDMLGLFMTSVANDKQDIIRSIDNYMDFHSDPCNFKNSVMSLNEFQYKRKSYGIVASALTGNAEMLDHFTHNGADLTADKPFVIRQITEIIYYLDSYYNRSEYDREHYGISYFGNEKLLSDLDNNRDCTRATLDKTELYTAMAITAIKNISRYYSIGMTRFIKSNTDIFSESHDPSSTASVDRHSYREDFLKAELLSETGIDIADLSSLLRLRDPYRYIKAYAQAARDLSTVIVPQYMLCRTMQGDSREYGSCFDTTSGIIVFLRLLADITPVRLQVILDAERTPETLKAAEILSEYFIVNFSEIPVAETRKPKSRPLERR